MASGNFVVGNRMGLGLFDEYVLPALEEKGYAVPDKLGFEINLDDKVLISLVGEGDLEQTLSDTLVEIGDRVEQKRKEGDPLKYEGELVWELPFKTFVYEGEGTESKRVDVGVYETVGLYQGSDTASQLFPGIAQKYVIAEAERKAESASRTIKRLLSTKLGNL